MLNITFAAYATLDVNDERYEERPIMIRSDTLKAITAMKGVLKRATEIEARTVSIYPSKGKVNIKLRVPEQDDHRNIVHHLDDKEGIYETVLGMVMDGRS